jgi:hypothetical protein
MSIAQGMHVCMCIYIDTYRAGMCACVRTRHMHVDRRRRRPYVSDPGAAIAIASCNVYVFALV